MDALLKKKAAKIALIDAILAIVDHKGPIFASWPEADSLAGYAVRKDGQYIGICDYQRPGPGKLDELSLGDLGAIIENASTVNHSDFEISKEMLDWINE